MGVHAWTQLDKLFDNSSTFALGTFLYVFASLAIAFLAVSVPFDFYVFHSANVDIVESDLDFNKLGLGFAGAGISLSSTKEAAEDVAHSASSWGSAVLDTLFTVLVVELSLFRIGQGLVSVGYFLELVRVTSFIGMFLEGLSSEGFSDLLGGGLLIDTEELVVLGCVDLFFLLG